MVIMKNLLIDRYYSDLLMYYLHFTSTIGIPILLYIGIRYINRI